MSTSFTTPLPVVMDQGRISRVSYLPCLVNKLEQPEILKNDKRRQEIFQYVDKITWEADLNARYKLDGDEVVIRANEFPDETVQ